MTAFYMAGSEINYPVRRDPKGREYMQVGDRCIYPARSRKPQPVTEQVYSWPIVGRVACICCWQAGDIERA